MKRAFYIVGPTASGKSDIAVEVATRCGAEIVNADAFQIYRGLQRLTAQPAPSMLGRVRHHLVGTMHPGVEMSAVRFVEQANALRLDRAIVVSGSGLYVRALAEGLSPLPAGSAKLREQLDQFSSGELIARLRMLDPEAARVVDLQNRRRVARAVEVCLLSGRRFLAHRATKPVERRGVFVFRDRDDLYDRINRRVEEMFAAGVVDEVKAIECVGPTAEQAIGLREIRQLLAGEITVPECIARIQQATRRYAKRQLTWFRRQTNFEPLNLSQRSTVAAVEWIVQKARLSFSE